MDFGIISRGFLGSLLATLFVVTACVKPPPPPPPTLNESIAQAPPPPGAPAPRFKPKVEVTVLKEGQGPSAHYGDLLVVHFTGSLPDGRVFNSTQGKAPFAFHINTDEVIDGWNIGLAQIKVGEKRRLIVPPELGYGGHPGASGLIPPQTPLTFEVELLAINPE